MTTLSHSKAALRLWLRLLACESLMEHHVRTMLREEFRVTLPQFDVLAELDYVGEPLSMTDLSRQLMVSNGNITGVVDRLVRDGLVQRSTSSNDRRVQLIKLSAKGKRTFRKIAIEHENWIGRALADLELDELQLMTKLLSKASVKLKENYGRAAR